MLQVLLLLLLAKLQDHVCEGWPAWRWALLFAALTFLFGIKSGAGAALMGAAVSGLYAWGYFALLRRVSESVAIWLAVYLMGAVLPFVLAFGMAG